jgi:hypothetical protein
MAFLLKAKKLPEARIYFQKTMKLVYCINFFILLVLICGLLMYSVQGISSVNIIPIIPCLFFVISAAFDVPWNVWIILPLSVNDHNNLALRFLLSSILTLALTVPAYKTLGISGIALILLIQDLVMTRQSIRQGKQILGFA